MAQVQLRIALWHGKATPTAPSHLLTGDFATRLGAVKSALNYAREKWLDAPSGGTLPVLKIFVGPEGLLVKSDEESAINYDQFKMESSGLREASKGLLFIPGTVIWKKPAIKTTGETSAPIDRLEKIQSKLDRYYERGRTFSEKKNPSASPPWHEGKGASRVEKVKKKLAKLRQDWDGGENVFIVRNAAYAYYEQVRLLKYYKQIEYKPDYKNKTGEISQKEKNDSKAIKFIPGYEEGVFQVPLSEQTNLRCGLEICADHYDGELKNSKTGSGVHLHFILSDYIYNYSNNVAVQPGGYIVHASTVRSESGLYTHELKQVEPGQAEDWEVGTMKFYAVLLEV